MENRYKIILLTILFFNLLYANNQLEIDAKNKKVDLNVCNLEIPDRYRLKFLNRDAVFFDYVDKNITSKIYANKYFNINISAIDKNNFLMNLKNNFIEIDRIKFKNFTTRIYKFKNSLYKNKISLYTVIGNYIVNMNIKKDELNVFLDSLKKCDKEFNKKWL